MGPAEQREELSSGLCDELAGARGGRFLTAGVSGPVTDLLCCTAGTHTTLSSNYTLKKEKKKRK